MSQGHVSWITSNSLIGWHSTNQTNFYCGENEKGQETQFVCAFQSATYLYKKENWGTGDTISEATFSWKQMVPLRPWNLGLHDFSDSLGPDCALFPVLLEGLQSAGEDVIVAYNKIRYGRQHEFFHPCISHLHSVSSELFRHTKLTIKSFPTWMKFDAIWGGWDGWGQL